MVGHVPSPTPIGPTSGDSITVTCSPELEAAQWSAAMTPAVSQPADPPPAITTCLIRLLPVVIASAIVTKEPLVGVSADASAKTPNVSSDRANARPWMAGLDDAPGMAAWTASSLLPELVPRSDHVAGSGLRHEQRLRVGAAVNALDLIRDVDRFCLQRQVVAP